VAGNGWLDRFIGFQRNLRFWSKLADRVADFQKKDDFLNVLSFMFVDSEAHSHDYPLRVFTHG